MGQSESKKDIVDDPYRHEILRLDINGFKITSPEFSGMRNEFKSRISSAVWNQFVMTLNESLTTYGNSDDYESWQSAYNAIHCLKLFTFFICIIPFCLIVTSIILCIFLLFWALFLVIIGVDHAFYIYIGTYNILSIEAKLILFGSYIVGVIGVIILYFTQRSLKPLQQQYVQHVARYISVNLNVLNKVYQRNISFDLKWIKIRHKLRSISCQCKTKGLRFTACIQVQFLSEFIHAIEDGLILDALNSNIAMIRRLSSATTVSSRSQLDIQHVDEIQNLQNAKPAAPYIVGSYPGSHPSSLANNSFPGFYYNSRLDRAASFGYYYHPVEGPDEDAGDIQTDISIEIELDEYQHDDFE